MAMSLLPEAVGSAARRKRNWSYYLPKCDHGSSLSMAVHARVAAELDLGSLAYDMFRAALAIDFDDVLGNGRDGLHAATQGGILQATLFGFAGLRLEDDQPVLRPHLPAHWTRVGLSFSHHGTRFAREVPGKKPGRPKASSLDATTRRKHESK